MNHVFRWAVAAVSVIILTVVLASNAKAADSVGLELESTVSLKYVDGNKYQASSKITPRGGGQYGYQLSLELHELKLKDTGYQINLATEQNQFDNVWGYLESNSNHLKSEGVINSETNQPVMVTYEARPKAGLPAGNYRGEVQYAITAKPAPEPVVKEIDSKEYRDNDDVKISIKGENLSSIESVKLFELFDQSDKNKPVAIGKKEDNKSDSSDGTSITFDFGNLSAGRYFATVYFVGGKPHEVSKPLVVWPRGDCVSGNSEFNKCKVVLPQSNDTRFIPVVPSGEGKWRVVADVTGDNSQFGEWYDYNKQHWANVVEVPKKKYQTFIQAGTVLDKNDYIRHWSYIPRYDYKVQRRDVVDRPMKLHDSKYSFDIKFSDNNDFKIPSPTCSSETDHRDYLDECHPLQPWATPRAFKHQGKIFDGVWLSDTPVPINGSGDMNMDIYRSNFIKSGHWANNDDWGAMVYLAMSKYGINNFTTLTRRNYLNATCLVSDVGDEDGDCWGMTIDRLYVLAATVDKQNDKYPWITYYDTQKDIVQYVNGQCTFEQCGGQALYELLGTQRADDIIYDNRIKLNRWMGRDNRLNRIYYIDPLVTNASAMLAWPVGESNIAVVSSLTASQRLQSQLKAAQPNRISEQASSVKLETSQQVGATEATKTSERLTTRPFDQQLSPAVSNRTEGTVNHAVVDDAIPQVKRQRQAVTTGPVLCPNGASGQTSLVTGQSPVAGVLGTEQNFVKQGLTHANSLMTAE